MIARPTGSSVRLKCTASGQPRPDIVWLKDNRPLDGVAEGAEERGAEEGGGGGEGGEGEGEGEGGRRKWTLSLRNLRPEHSGKYTCRVSNAAGEIHATYKLDVIGKPRPPPALAVGGSLFRCYRLRSGLSWRKEVSTLFIWEMMELLLGAVLGLIPDVFKRGLLTPRCSLTTCV